MTSPLDLIANLERVQKLQDLLAEAYADADEVLRPRVAQLEAQLAELEKAVAAEREACAKVCEELRHPFGWSAETEDWTGATDNCAAAIRARGG